MNGKKDKKAVGLGCGPFQTYFYNLFSSIQRSGSIRIKFLILEYVFRLVWCRGERLKCRVAISCAPLSSNIGGDAKNTKFMDQVNVIVVCAANISVQLFSRILHFSSRSERMPCHRLHLTIKIRSWYRRDTIREIWTHDGVKGQVFSELKKSVAKKSRFIRWYSAHRSHDILCETFSSSCSRVMCACRWTYRVTNLVVWSAPE